MVVALQLSWTRRLVELLLALFSCSLPPLFLLCCRERQIMCNVCCLAVGLGSLWGCSWCSQSPELWWRWRAALPWCCRPQWELLWCSQGLQPMQGVWVALQSSRLRAQKGCWGVRFCIHGSLAFPFSFLINKVVPVGSLVSGAVCSS